ncbi:MAG: hypothetical protein PF795_00925 [Kiritimatiellae bacterium]|jgi:hypothetical protein|nr:hypothetical protein [Kiritimatiellia bacterium]
MTPANPHTSGPQRLNVVRNVAALIFVGQFLLWLAIGRKTIDHQIVSDSKIMLHHNSQQLETMKISTDDLGPINWIIDQETADRIGEKHLFELQQLPPPLNVEIQVREEYPDDAELDDACKLYYGAAWNTPLLAKTTWVSWAGGAGYTVQDHFHVFVLGFWFRIASGSGGGG